MSNGDAGPAMFVPWDVCGSHSCRRRRGSPFAPAPAPRRCWEADELLVPVALHVAADDGAVEHIEGGKQRRCAMAFVVVTSKNTPSARPANQIQIISLNLTTGSECDGAIGFL